MNLCPWADAVYGCDAAWWKHRKGLPEFSGLKLCWDGNGIHSVYPDVRGVKIARGDKVRYSERLSFEPGTIGGGGNSGFQALNLAIQFGAKAIALVGFDMSQRGHWYGRNNWAGSSNPDDENFRRWKIAFELAAKELTAHGVTVVNLSSVSALKCFTFRTPQEAFA